jgi:predicted O-methyltransferase YrrM
VLHIGDDLEILPRFNKGSFDWMYFDTTHTYEQTVEELVLAQSLVRSGGFICGDNWRDDPTHPHYGVRRAVEEFCAATRFHMVYASANDRQWAVRRA